MMEIQTRHALLKANLDPEEFSLGVNNVMAASQDD